MFAPAPAAPVPVDRFPVLETRPPWSLKPAPEVPVVRSDALPAPEDDWPLEPAAPEAPDEPEVPLLDPPLVPEDPLVEPEVPVDVPLVPLLVPLVEPEVPLVPLPGRRSPAGCAWPAMMSLAVMSAKTSDGSLMRKSRLYFCFQSRLNSSII